MLGALVTEKSIHAISDAFAIRSSTVSSFTVYVARIGTSVTVEASFTSSHAYSSISGTRAVATHATVIGTEIAVEAGRAVRCTMSIDSFAPVIETTRLTWYVALLSVKPNSTRTYARAQRSVTRARPTWRLTWKTIKSVFATVCTRAVGVKTLSSLAEWTACVLTASSPISFPTSSKTTSCRPVARAHAVITTLVACVPCFVVVAVTSITPFTDPTRRASSGTNSGSYVTRGSRCHINATFTALSAGVKDRIVTTHTSRTCQVAGRTTFTIWNVALTRHECYSHTENEKS